MPRIELLPNSGSAPAPGWAYVVDTGYDPSKIAINPTATGKRRRQGPSGAENSEASAAALQVRQSKRINQLDSDTSSKEVSIPSKKKDGAFKGGNTTNTRRILMSGKRFDNYLADEEAELRNGPPTKTAPSRTTDSSRRVSTVPRTPATPATPTTPATPSHNPNTINPIVIPPSYEKLLKSEVPSAPTQEELESLLAAPPLSYNASRVAPPDANGPPVRYFCAVCGYWGRIRCLKCGERVCRLECKRHHDATCSQFG